MDEICDIFVLFISFHLAWQKSVLLYGSGITFLCGFLNPHNFAIVLLQIVNNETWIETKWDRCPPLQNFRQTESQTDSSHFMVRTERLMATHGGKTLIKLFKKKTMKYTSQSSNKTLKLGLWNKTTTCLHYRFQMMYFNNLNTSL